MQCRDTSEYYGIISRGLHWAMAVVLALQFLTALAHLSPVETAVTEFLWGTHKANGFLVMVLVLVRATWAIANHAVRPPSVDALARLGHKALYVFMVMVPLLALLRAYGSGDPFSPFGIPLMPGFDGEEIGLLTAPAKTLIIISTQL
jgi:cytochrome b561